MKRKSGPKNIPWHTVSSEDWVKGYVHVANLMGVTPAAARAAHWKEMTGSTLDLESVPAPEGLQPTDSPAAVAKIHNVSTATARKWLALLACLPAAPAARTVVD